VNQIPDICAGWRRLRTQFLLAVETPSNASATWSEAVCEGQHGTVRKGTVEHSACAILRKTPTPRACPLDTPRLVSLGIVGGRLGCLLQNQHPPRPVAVEDRPTLAWKRSEASEASPKQGISSPLHWLRPGYVRPARTDLDPLLRPRHVRFRRVARGGRHRRWRRQHWLLSAPRPERTVPD
jgi:hypothetical protein